jgi:hypothetical protein
MSRKTITKTLRSISSFRQAARTRVCYQFCDLTSTA